MQLGTGILLCSVVVAAAVTGGCATGGAAGGYQSFIEKCLAAATTAQERNECAWKNAERMSSGR